MMAKCTLFIPRRTIMLKPTDDVIHKGQKCKVIYVMGGAAEIRFPNGVIKQVRADKLKRPEDFR